MASKCEWSGLRWTHCHLWTSRTHLSRFHLNPLSSICIFFFLNFIKNMYWILQTFFNHAILLVEVPDASSLGIGKLVFSSPSNEFVNSIDVWNEDVLYNWTDRAFLSTSKSANPLEPQRICILLFFLINVYSKIGSFVANLFASISTCFPSKKSFTVFA